MDGRSQEVLWDVLLHYGQPVICDRCVDEHNAMLDASGQDQQITMPFASDDIMLYLAARRMAGTQKPF